jgi:hypothetical protein
LSGYPLALMRIILICIICDTALKCKPGKPFALDASAVKVRDMLAE